MNLAPLWSNFRFKTGIEENIYFNIIWNILCVDLLLKSNNIKFVIPFFLLYWNCALIYYGNSTLWKEKMALVYFSFQILQKKWLNEDNSCGSGQSVNLYQVKHGFDKWTFSSVLYFKTFKKFMYRIGINVCVKDLLTE